MLEPRETDLPALFVVLVVLPLITYILLGKWSEAARKKDKISLLAQLAAEEALRAEAMAAAAAAVIPFVPLSNNGIHDVPKQRNGIHECARCYGPATTRCSRCKSVRYCSGTCQIIHWRQVHKHECQQLESNNSSSSPKPASDEESIHERVLFDDDMDSQCFGYNTKQHGFEKIPPDDMICPSLTTLDSANAACMTMDTPVVPVIGRRSIEKWVSCKSSREIFRGEDGAMLEPSEEAFRSRATFSTLSNIKPSKEAHTRHKLKFRESDAMLSEEEISRKHNVNIPGGCINGHTASRSTMCGSHKLQSQNDNLFDPRTKYGISSSLELAKNGKNTFAVGPDLVDGGNILRGFISSNDETAELKCPSERTSTKSSKAKSMSHSVGASKSTKTTMKVSIEQLCSDEERKGQVADDSKAARIKDTIPAQGSSAAASIGIMKMLGLMKSSKHDRQEPSEVNGDRHKKVKMLFPYKEFVKYFQYEVLDLSPRGLVNCGNSCYANAVLQCLTSTKPLAIYLLHRSHSRSCCAKNWCLMCELEQHVTMLRENGGPLSPSRILLHMRNINCQIGDGSQEDAHEFLRLLVTSMQSICLESLGGEKVVDPRLQETTFIQHTFGGRLRSKVKCLRCRHESERYENIMDLTLEIYGWVESLEDALTQFTSLEDLDGENMYRCERCAVYVRAQKQLSIQEAPNILTIVLKRFQEGSYGKINKCISFPDMLDMIPFMTGTEDIPPLYMLYAVVVHLDTLNASFSGHYVSYVKDLQGNWFRIDDTEVRSVPMSQVMLEGAYILFYMRSCPRPPRTFSGKPAWHQAPGFAKHWTSNTQKSSRPGQRESSCHFVSSDLPSNHKREAAMGFTDPTPSGTLGIANRNRLPMMETYTEPLSMEFSDATSSDWSIFTSSDEASFTTESTRDSFSTVDYADACNADPISSIFNSLYAPDYSSHKTVSCSRFTSQKSETRFASEGKSCLLDSYLSTQPLGIIPKVENSNQVSVPSTGAFPSDGKCRMHVKYGTNPNDGGRHTYYCNS